MPSSFRTFNSPGGQLVNGVAYIYDTVSGMFRPAFDSDFGAAVNMSVSGLSLTVGSVAITGTLPNVAVTGGAISVSNTAPIPVSGISIVGNTAPIPVSGVSLIGNTAPIATSGVATILSVPTHNVAVTGGQIQTIVTGVLGGNVTVSSVAITGAPVVTITGVLPVSTSVTVGNITVTGGSINVSNTAPMPISGVVQATVTTDNSSVVLAQASGNNLSIISNQLLSGISGQLTANVNSAAWVTGNVGTSDVINHVLLSGISGLLGANLTDPAYVTGNIFATDIVAERLLSGISGLLGASLTDAAWVTGNVGISNTAPIAISGIVQTVVTGAVSASVPNPLGVTGTKYDTALPAMPGTFNFLAAGGRVVNPSGAGSITGYNSTGDFAIFNIDKTNGGLLVTQGCLDYTQDSATVQISGAFAGSAPIPVSGVVQSNVTNTAPVPISGVTQVATSATVSNDYVSGAFQVVLPATPTRKGFFIQNLATGALMVRYSTSMPSTGNLNFVLAGGTADNDGKGASWSEFPAVWTGPLSVSGLGGAPMLYTAWQI